MLLDAIRSSLQRLEATTQSIDAGVQEIKTFLKRAQAGDLLLPVASALADADSMARIDFSRRCMEAAETAQRWTAISIEDWIKAGRWWLLNVRFNLQSFLLFRFKNGGIDRYLLGRQIWNYVLRGARCRNRHMSTY